jgi:endoglucanase
MMPRRSGGSVAAVDDDAILAVAEALLAMPTAPFREALPTAEVERAATAAGLPVGRDAAGNLVVRYDAPGADGTRPLVLVAHLDHPGFSVTAVDGDELALEFHGGLLAANATPGSPLHLYAPGQVDRVGEAVLVAATEDGGRLTGATARRTGGEAPDNSYAMWGLPAFDVVDGRITSRVCDDLLGAAAVLATLTEVARRRPEGASVWGLFTRAEEVGFLGTLEAIRLDTVPPDADVLSLECSKALVDAPQGGGVIVRVGDRMSIFDPGLTAALGTAAADLATVDDGFRWQRKLMDGGACEATAFCAAGYRASGLALPLGGYHNASDGEPGIVAETVEVADYLAEVRLLVELACRPALLRPPDGPPAWLAERTAKARAALGAA